MWARWLIYSHSVFIALLATDPEGLKTGLGLFCFYAQEVSLRRDNSHIVGVACDVIDGAGTSL